MILTSSPPPLGGVFLIFHCLFVLIVYKYTSALPQCESEVYSQITEAADNPLHRAPAWENHLCVWARVDFV